MRERFEKIIERMKGMRDRVGIRNIAFLLIVAFIIILTAFVLVRLTRNVGYEILYTGLPENEQVEILGVIQGLKVETKSTDDGKIYVPEGKADSIRAQLAVQGYPKNGMSYDIFTENVSLTSTEFEKETFKLYQLQDRLEQTIKHFDGVRNATVTITQKESSDYVIKPSEKDDSKEGIAKASVMVTMENGGSPSSEQVKGMQKLVASSVPDMSADSVTVIDGNGNEVSNTGDGSGNTEDASSLSTLKIQLEQQAENSLKVKILNLLEPIYGKDKVKVAVNCTVDIDKTLKEAVTYYPSEDGDNSGVKSSEGLNWESIGTGTAATGVVGTETNSEIPTYPYSANNEEGQYYSDKRTYEYLVSKLTEQVQKDAGSISDTSVSVVIDSGALTPNEVSEIQDLVAVTSNIPRDQADAKVVIMDTKFASAKGEDGVDNMMARLLSFSPMLYILAAAAVILLISVIVGVIALRARKKKLEAQMALLEPDEDEDEGMSEIDDINLSEIKETKEQALKDQIRDFASQNPEIAANLIKNWLRNEEE